MWWRTGTDRHGKCFRPGLRTAWFMRFSLRVFDVAAVSAWYTVCNTYIRQFEVIQIDEKICDELIFYPFLHASGTEVLQVCIFECIILKESRKFHFSADRIKKACHVRQRWRARVRRERRYEQETGSINDPGWLRPE